jgi:tape measure domain-containing protein
MSTETVTYLLKLRDKFSKPMSIANQGVNSLDKGSQSAAISIGKVGMALGALGVFAAGKAILQAGMNMEQTRVAFATFLGDANKANQTIAELNQFSNITPFNNDEVIKSGRVLLAAQVPAENLTKTLKNIGDVASGSQVPLTELTGIYAKVLNKGKVQAEELNQLAERGVPILQVLADQYGVTSKEILKMGSEGKLTSDNIAEAFDVMSSEGGLFFNMMEKQSATAAGKLSTLQGGLGLLAAELGERANPAMGEILDKLINLTNFLKENQETVITVVKVMAQLTAAFIAYKATVIATQKATLLFNAVQKASVITNIFFTKGIKKARVAMRLFNVTAKANPIGLIVSGLILAIPLMLKLFSSTNKLSSGMQALANVNKRANKLHADQAAKLRVLKSTLDQGNLSQKKRSEIISQINKQYGEYLPKLLTEKSTDEEIAAALKTVNDELLRKARIQAGKDIILENAREAVKLERLLRNEKELTAEATKGFANQAALLGSKIGFQGEKQEKALVDKKRKDLNERLKQLSEEDAAILKLTNTEVNRDRIKKKAIDGNGGVSLDGKSRKTLETGIKAGAAKQVIINIGNLVENFEIKTENIKQAPIRVKEEMTKVLLDAVNDASLMQR